MQSPRQTPGVSSKRLRRGMPVATGTHHRAFFLHTFLFMTHLQVTANSAHYTFKTTWSYDVTSLGQHANEQVCKMKGKRRGTANVSRNQQLHSHRRGKSFEIWKQSLAQPDKTCASGLAGRGTSFLLPSPLIHPNLWAIAHVNLNESDWYPAFLVSGSGIHHLHIWPHTDRMNEGNGSKREREWWHLASKGMILAKPAGKMCLSYFTAKYPRILIVIIHVFDHLGLIQEDWEDIPIYRCIFFSINILFDCLFCVCVIVKQNKLSSKISIYIKCNGSRLTKHIFNCLEK